MIQIVIRISIYVVKLKHVESSILHLTVDLNDAYFSIEYIQM